MTNFQETENQTSQPLRFGCFTVLRKRPKTLFLRKIWIRFIFKPTFAPDNLRNGVPSR